MASLGHSSRRCVVFRLMALSRWRSVIATFGLLAVVFVGLAVSARGRGVAPAGHGHVVPRAAARYGVQIQAVFDRFGDPLLVANFTPDGSLASPVWLLCPAATPNSCHSVQAHHGELAPGAEPAGTRFVATAVYRGARYSRAATWHGRVHALRPPSLAGARRMGGLVRPAAGRWAGGWGDESDQLGVEACRLATGQECRMLGGGELGCPDRSSLTRLGGWFTSWYLFAVDARIPRDSVCAGTGYSANADLPLWNAGPTVARSRAGGRVVGPRRPQVRILPEAIQRGGELLVVAVDCLTRCRIALTVADNSVGMSRLTTAVGPALVGVSRGPIGHGRLMVTLHVDDGPLIAGHSRLP